MSKTTKIDIWSDVQCGWCFIGKRRLEAAIEGFDGEVEIEYHSFELASGAPAEFDGATKEFLHHYRGAPFAETERMLAKVTAIAAVEGLDFHFDRTHPTNTILAHELIHFAKSKGRQSEMNERLSDAYFQRGEHIGRIPDLVEIGVELGFDRDDVSAALTEHRCANRRYAVARDGRGTDSSSRASTAASTADCDGVDARTRPASTSRTASSYRGSTCEPRTGICRVSIRPASPRCR
jgi:predicted DsbA family dithiol-disulfide isomerase